MEVPRMIPQMVIDIDNWHLAKEIDEKATDLSQWEIEFLESLFQQMIGGRRLSEKQVKKLKLIKEEKVR